MSQKALSTLMYAIIMTKSKVTSTFGIGIYQFNRSQNAYNHVDVMIEIDEQKVIEFEEMTGLDLKEQGKMTLNHTKQ